MQHDFDLNALKTRLSVASSFAASDTDTEDGNATSNEAAASLVNAAGLREATSFLSGLRITGAAEADGNTDDNLHSLGSVKERPKFPLRKTYAGSSSVPATSNKESSHSSLPSTIIKAASMPLPLHLLDEIDESLQQATPRVHRKPSKHEKPYNFDSSKSPTSPIMQALGSKSPSLGSRPSLSRSGSGANRDRSGSLSKRFSHTHQRSLSRSGSQQSRRSSHRSSVGSSFPKRKALGLEPKELLEVLSAEWKNLEDSSEQIPTANLSPISNTSLSKSTPLVIDVRPLPVYLGSSGRIKKSINCNFPSLLMKRFKKGKIGNFTLESFITTEAGKSVYREAVVHVQAQTGTPLTPNLSDTQQESLVPSLKALTDMDIFVIDEMIQDLDGNSTGSILVTILEQLLETHVGSGSLCYLRGSFAALRQLELASKCIVEGEDSVPSDAESASSSGRTHRSKKTAPEGLTIQPPQPSYGGIVQPENPAHAVTAENRPRLRRIDTSERLRLGSHAHMPDMSSNQSPSSTRQSRSPSPLLFDKSSKASSASTLSDSPAKPPRPETAMSLQELCRFQASTPQSTSFDHTPRRRQAMDNESPGTAVPGEEPEEFIVSSIIPNFLYLGPEPITAEDVKELENLGIKQILNMALEIDGRPGLAMDKHFEKYTKIPMRDFVEEKGVQKRIDEACLILDDADLKSKPVYVHCRAGKSRSVTIVLAYLIHRYHWSLKRAYAHVAERRKGISPNIGFISELMRYEERSLRGRAKGSGGSENSMPPLNHARGLTTPQSASVPGRPSRDATHSTGASQDEDDDQNSAWTQPTWARMRESLPPSLGHSGKGFDFQEITGQQIQPVGRVQIQRAETDSHFLASRRSSMR